MGTKVGERRKAPDPQSCDSTHLALPATLLDLEKAGKNTVDIGSMVKGAQLLLSCVCTPSSIVTTLSKSIM
jgi:hypothetical protein